MKTLSSAILFLIGLSEVVLGVVFGRIRIYAYELGFFRDLGLTQDQSQIFRNYIVIFKDQWHIVAWLGIITITATLILLRSTKIEATDSPKDPAPLN